MKKLILSILIVTNLFTSLHGSEEARRNRRTSSWRNYVLGSALTLGGVAFLTGGLKLRAEGQQIQGPPALVAAPISWTMQSFGSLGIVISAPFFYAGIRELINPGVLAGEERKQSAKSSC